jgi:hypothetical protein
MPWWVETVSDRRTTVKVFAKMSEDLDDELASVGFVVRNDLLKTHLSYWLNSIFHLRLIKKETDVFI